MKTQVKTFLGSLALVVPVSGYPAEVIPATQPLFLSGSVKHNLMLAIDDSGSMDFETLFPTNDGALWLSEDGEFTKLDGTYFDSGSKYTSLFPNGSGGANYTNAGTINPSTHFAVPPIKAYAFARSSEYNRGYYDPAVSYEPWPSYGGHAFAEYSGTAAPYDPNFVNFTLNLTAALDTSTKAEAQWGFDIEADGMVCDDNGGTCTAGTKNYTYYPATYWVIDNASTYTFDPTAANRTAFYTDNSVLLEAESGTLTGDYKQVSVEAGYGDPDLVADASAKDYIVSPTGNRDDGLSPASYGQLDINFTVPTEGLYRIWIRKRSIDDSDDSLWVNLFGYGDTEIDVTIADNPFVSAADGQQWVKWWQNWTHDGDWSWDELGTVTLSPAKEELLRIRVREAGVPVDQILITKEDQVVPSGVIALLAPPAPVSLNCAVEADADPKYYAAFRRFPGAFSGVDALAPDGRCLQKVEIRSDVATYPSGRNYAEELQNFSNWFTYYRRRHQAMRGGLGAAFQGIGGIQAGIYWINTIRDVTMYDLDESAELTQFLTDHYGHVLSGGTPLRSALNHSRTQYQRTGDSAPIQYECQKNFTLLFTDGYAESETVANIGNADGSAGAPYQDSYRSTMADVAYKMYTDNPRPTLTEGAVPVPTACSGDNVPANLDCNANLHINTYTVGLGAQGTIFGVTHDDVQDAYDNAPTWPDVSSIRDPRQIDDLYHAAVNGRGEIFNAQTPALLRTELSAALRNIISSLGSASGVTFNSATLESDSLIFSALFNSTAWSGDVEARELDPATGSVNPVPVWGAAERLGTQVPSQRTILTYSRDPLVLDGIPFRYESGDQTLDSGQVADLNTSPAGASDGLAMLRAAYLRGDRSEEGGLFRNRDGLLGDIVNSTPLYVGAPRLNWPDSGLFGDASHPYSAFRGDESNVHRTPMIYVGSNDGMLHGFKAVEDPAQGGGQELMAYIPRSVFSSGNQDGLHYLTDPAYRHRNYVDLSPQAVDVFMPATAGGVAEWRTVLIGGLRGGGAGLFALDITNPANFSETNAADLVLWELDESDFSADADTAGILNYQLEQPVVAMMNNGRWALLMGNGFSNGATANDEKTGLLIVYLDGGLDGSWTAGTDYQFLSVGSTGGLGAVNVVDVNGDRVADRVYGGDLQGNLWVFDVSDTNDSKWGAAFTDGGGANAPAAPLFTAEVSVLVDADNDGQVDDPVNVRQPIAMRPLVLRNILSPAGEEGSKGEDYLIYFGTGKYFEEGDPADTSPQSMYGVWDRGDGQITRAALLQEQTITTNGNLREVSENSIDWTGEVEREYGWYMDLPESGERVLNSPKFRGEVLFFETYTPDSNPCAAGGSSWFMSVSMDGTEPDFPTFDANNDGRINEEDGIHGGQRFDNASTGATGILDKNQYYQDESGDPTMRAIDYGEDQNRAGRLGWHELTDF